MLTFHLTNHYLIKAEVLQIGNVLESRAVKPDA
jgi:hypothetical protein